MGEMPRLNVWKANYPRAMWKTRRWIRGGLVGKHLFPVSLASTAKRKSASKAKVGDKPCRIPLICENMRCGVFGTCWSARAGRGRDQAARCTQAGVGESRMTPALEQRALLDRPPTPLGPDAFTVTLWRAIGPLWSLSAADTGCSFDRLGRQLGTSCLNCKAPNEGLWSWPSSMVVRHALLS